MILQRRQIVIKTLDYQIDIEDPVCMKYASTSFHSIVWVFISVNVTIYRLLHYQRVMKIVFA